MRSISITHASRPGAVLSLLAVLILALPSVADAAVFAPPPGTPTTTAPAPATPSTPAATTPAPSATKPPATTPKTSHEAVPKATPKGAQGAAKPTAPATTQTVPARTATTAAESSSGSGNTALMIAFVAAVALLVGIAYMILRDAHSVAPVSDGPSGGGTRDPAARLRRRRRKAKVAKQSRKRNR